MADKKFILKKLPNGSEIALTADLSVGRSLESGLKLVEGSPSRKHAMLLVTTDSVSVQDLGSTNGTFVNDQRVDSKVLLKSGDCVRFDVEEYLFRVELPEPPSDLTVRRPLPAALAPAPAPAPAAPAPAAAAPAPRPAPARTPAPAAPPVPAPAPAPAAVVPPAPAVAPAPIVPPAPAAAPAAVPAAKPPAAKPPADLVADSGRVKVPAGWVDNASAAGNKTQFMTPEQMEAERRRAMASAAAQVSPGRIDTPQLIVPGDPEGSTRVQLRASDTGKKEWTVGSEGDREILINRVGVSTLHAKIVNDGNRWKVVDQLSANGTFVNGKRCNVSYLASGDRIAFGSVECTFQLPKGGGSGHAGAAPATSGGAGASGTRLKKVLVIAGIAFVITLVVLFLLLNRFG